MTTPEQTLPLDADALLAEASRRQNGLTDFGDPSFLQGLKVLLKSLNEEAKLSATGRALLANRIVESLSNRLSLEDYCSRFPAILDEVVSRPIVIVGLPRTGTTMLQRVLACDPRFYHSAWWEVRFPSPFVDEEPGKPTGRIEAAKAEVQMIVDSMPDLLAIHPLDAELADEEVILMEHSFLSAMDAYANVPSYVQWLSEQDQTPAYLYLKRQLQFLQWQKRLRGETAERWLLKSPHHLHAMDSLFKIFPDAFIVQTHRDPLQTIPSMASFAYTIWKIYSDEASPADAGRIWSSKMAKGIGSTMRFRDSMPQDRFIDVWYLDAVAHSMDVVRRLYPAIGMTLSPETEARMEKWLKQSSRENRPAHEYSIEKMALSEEQLRHDFDGYRSHYIQPHQASVA